MRKLLNWILKFLSSRLFMVSVIIILQIVLLYFGMATIRAIPYVDAILSIFDFILLIHVANRDSNTSYKLVWALIIYVIPVIGGLIYVMFAEKEVPKSLRNEMTRSIANSEGLLKQKEKYKNNLEDEDIAQQFNYVLNASSYPYYQNSAVKYFGSGAEAFDDMLAHIRKAKHFIFLEYFIIKNGVMLESLVNELTIKVNEGVEVYFMYDDFGSITSAPENFVKDMNAKGMHCVEFSKVSAYLSLLSKNNNRDHRKICVIDNRVAYLGGFNIADEYIGKKIRFGVWKDSGVRIEGEAVNNITIMFIQFYNAMVEENINYRDYLLPVKRIKNDSFVLPFSNSPSDKVNVARTVHLNLITHAKKYIYISTPYLILDHDFMTALITASRSGVEVIINVPHIPDKKTVFAVTRSNYDVLVRNGVRVFEYTPGFVHSKLIVSDDKIAVEGSINMDHRSYYLQYESGVLIANDESIMDMKQDYLNTIAESKEVLAADVENIPFLVKMFRGVMRLISPLF